MSLLHGSFSRYTFNNLSAKLQVGSIVELAKSRLSSLPWRQQGCIVAGKDSCDISFAEMQGQSSYKLYPGREAEQAHRCGRSFGALLAVGSSIFVCVGISLLI